MLYREMNIPDTSGILSWSHYLELKDVNNTDARAFYETACKNSRWSVEELERQIDTSLFERLLYSEKGAINEVKALLKHEQEAGGTI